MHSLVISGLVFVSLLDCAHLLCRYLGDVDLVCLQCYI